MPIAAGKYLYMAKTYVKEKFGDEGLVKVIARLKAADQEIYNGIILSTTEYSLFTYQHFLGAMAQEYGDKELELYSEDLANKMLFGFFGMIAKFISLDMGLTKATQMWRKSFGEGVMVVKEKTDHSTVLRLTDFVMHDDVPLDSKEMYWYTMSGEVFIRQVISLILGKPVKSSHKVLGRKVYEFYYEF